MELGFRYFLNQPFFKKIIIINIIVFLLPLVLNTFLFLFNLKQFSLINYFDLHPGIGDIIRSPWTLISYSFFHIDFFHIFWNMLILYYSGSIFLNLFKKNTFINVYFMGVIAVSYTHLRAHET